MRLDAGVARLLGLSRTTVAEMIDAGDVLVDGVPVARSSRMALDTWLEITLLELTGRRGRPGPGRGRAERSTGTPTSSWSTSRSGWPPTPARAGPGRPSWAHWPAWASPSAPPGPPNGRGSCTGWTWAPPG
ncbi:MAG: S4 domain-containing protein [Nakamurella multipartita]